MLQAGIPQRHYATAGEEIFFKVMVDEVSLWAAVCSVTGCARQGRGLVMFGVRRGGRRVRSGVATAPSFGSQDGISANPDSVLFPAAPAGTMSSRTGSLRDALTSVVLS